MGERLGTTQVALQKEKVEEEIGDLIKFFEDLAIKVDNTKKIKGVAGDLDLTKQADRIINQIKIIDRKLSWMKKVLFELKLENINRSIANFYDEVKHKIEEKEVEIEQKQRKLEKIQEALQKMKGRVEKV